jgi:hypothetical protein
MASFPFPFPAMAGAPMNNRGAPQHQIQQQQQFMPPPQAAAAANNGNADDDELIDAIEQILSAEENRRIVAASPSAFRQGAAPIPNSSAGPLTGQEFSILSLLCTKVASQKANASAVARLPGSSQDPLGFGAVDGDLLTTLTELLEKHVNLAVGVDLVQEAVDVIHKREKIDQVRCKRSLLAK